MFQLAKELLGEVQGINDMDYLALANELKDTCIKFFDENVNVVRK
jgi:hypothetical protein